MSDDNKLLTDKQIILIKTVGYTKAKAYELLQLLLSREQPDLKSIHSILVAMEKRLKYALLTLDEKT